jgi:hypothetical protein
VAGLADRRRWHGGGSGEVDVVVADDRDVVGDPELAAGHLLEHAEGQQVVGAEYGRRAAPAGQFGDLGADGAPDEKSVAGVSILISGESGRPAPARVRLAPSKRSETCLKLNGPPTKTIRVCPCSSRWGAASSPP